MKLFVAPEEVAYGNVTQWLSCIVGNVSVGLIMDSLKTNVNNTA